MKATTYVVALAAFLLGRVAGVDATAQDVQPFIAALPTCAQDCAAPILSALPCTMGTFQQYTDCTCPDMTTRGQISACLQMRCNLTDTFQSFGVGYEMCKDYPAPSRGAELTRTASTLLALVLICVCLKTWTRVITGNKFWWDDWLLWASAVWAVIYYALLIRASFGTLGRHIFTVDPTILRNELKILFVVKPFYILAQNLVKLSILCFYLRLFPQRWFRYCIFGALFVIAVYAFSFVLMEIFLCTPIQGSWDQSIPSKCLNEPALIYIGSGVSIVSDLIILGLPVPVVLKLKLGLGKRIGLVFMLGLGSFACVTTIVRLRYIAAYDNLFDPPWDNFDIGLWSAIEVGTATICACLAALRPLLATFLPRVFGNSSGRTAAGRTGARGGGGGGGYGGSGNGISHARSGYVKSVIGRSSVANTTTPPGGKPNRDIHVMHEIAMRSETDQSEAKESRRESEDGLV